MVLVSRIETNWILRAEKQAQFTSWITNLTRRKENSIVLKPAIMFMG